MAPIGRISDVEQHANRVVDHFTVDRRPGTVIGTTTEDGDIRLGCDLEKQIAIDNNALRFQPLIRPGWGRQGIAYGPFARTPGLVLGVAINNGHNTSQGGSIPESFLRRCWQWARGPFADPLASRALGWLRAPRRRLTFRRLFWWQRSTRWTYRLPSFEENLAVGFFTQAEVPDPLSDGCGLIVHAAEGENGELWARVGRRCLIAFRRLKNTKIYYIVALRENGAVYYAAGMRGAQDIAEFPNFRPIAVDPFNTQGTIYAGVHQCALGQIGFRVDTRVDSIQIAEAPELSNWYGSAHAADRLSGPVPGLGNAEIGGAWRTIVGSISRSESGAIASTESTALLEPGETTGLLHALIEIVEEGVFVRLLLSADCDGNGWAFEVADSGCRLQHVGPDRAEKIAELNAPMLTIGQTHSVQILVSERSMHCYIDGQRVLTHTAQTSRQPESHGVGFTLSGAGARLRSFEAHPRQVPLPSCLEFKPPWHRLGEKIEFEDTFAGAAGDLEGRMPTTGSEPWRRTFGRGHIVADGEGKGLVRASLQEPNPGRTFYTLPWQQPTFADLEVEITPPGSARNQGHRGRAGLVFWQDNDNYVSCSCWLDDCYGGASISFFPKRYGFEELYDAVWTNVADKIYWGRPMLLRISFDGNNFLVTIDGEPMLQKSLRDIYPDDAALRINRVGLALNWEWGNDTGSSFASFKARS